ncbi:hypothetical protein ACJX0J_018006 [Zea mays]
MRMTTRHSAKSRDCFIVDERFPSKQGFTSTENKCVLVKCEFGNLILRDRDVIYLVKVKLDEDTSISPSVVSDFGEMICICAGLLHAEWNKSCSKPDYLIILIIHLLTLANIAAGATFHRIEQEHDKFIYKMAHILC